MTVSPTATTGALSVADVLERLAERVEAAAGASDELDLAIATASYEVGFPIYGERVNYDPALWVQRYGPISASLDAAKSLTPEEEADRAVFWRVGNDGEGGDPAAFKATVLVCTNLTSRQSEATADSAPLALTAASLRARAAIAREQCCDRPVISEQDHREQSV